MIGDALRRIEQNTGLHDEIAQAITPAMLDEALYRLERIESSRDEVTQKMEEVLHRVEEFDDAQGKMAETIEGAFTRIEEIERVQEEVSLAIAPMKGKELRFQIYEARKDLLEVLQPAIERIVQRKLSDTVQRLAETLLLSQVTTATNRHGHV
jgi:hypothetical protein